MRTRSDRRPNRNNDRKVLMAEESTKSWADTDSDSSSSSSSSSSDSKQEEVHCLMADQTSEDEVFDFANIEFTREDLIDALNDMVKEYKNLSHSFEEIKVEKKTSPKLNHQVKAGIGFQRPENSKPSWIKNKLDKDKAKAGSKSFVPNQPRRNSTKNNSGIPMILVFELATASSCSEVQYAVVWISGGDVVLVNAKKSAAGVFAPSSDQSLLVIRAGGVDNSQPLEFLDVFLEQLFVLASSCWDVSVNMAVYFLLSICVYASCFIVVHTRIVHALFQIPRVLYFAASYLVYCYCFLPGCEGERQYRTLISLLGLLATMRRVVNYHSSWARQRQVELFDASGNLGFTPGRSFNPAGGSPGGGYSIPVARNNPVATIQSQAIQSQAIQSQLSSRKLSSRKLSSKHSVSTKPEDVALLPRLVPQFPSWSPSRNTISSRDWFFNSSTGHSLTSAMTARRNTSATTDFPHFHQLQATVTIKFQILPVVGYSTVDSIFGGIRHL
ncbi:hypothetical protein F511_06451 [Dorcoceras hygrometricum]|uniref:Transmembrane protein n=1 Tax=Dorcoceras hygrometricum TaxID=472368 RepID=A0A2Z7B2R3_9LAMI|nr:hypothetical protein F511_06451 [Dorcoceras hygrometricum]